MHTAPRAERVHIGIFGGRNVGKSSLINALTNQSLAVVSAIKGTTTDPVFKSMEMLPLGPVVLIDTPGLDDTGELGALRVQKAREVLDQTDIALLVVDAKIGLLAQDQELLQELQARKVPYLVVANKLDQLEQNSSRDNTMFYVSAQTGAYIEQLRERIAKLLPTDEKPKKLLADLLIPSELVVLVTPIDSSAPKGRLILPQQQTIREILDTYAMALTTQPAQLSQTLQMLNRPPAMVVTDSQVFAQVSEMVPKTVPLTSFSILFARYKGILETTVRSVRTIDTLENGDAILIAEGCTHHRQCEDIGTVKLPNWIRKHTGKQIEFDFSSGGGFAQDLTPYKLVVHCGGCMLSDRQVQHRMNMAQSQEVPMTNYGILIAYMKGILPRSLALFPEISALL